MTDQQFETLVSRLEGQARSNPGGYQFKVLLLALLGNAYLGAIVALIAGVLAVLAASILVLKALAIKLILIVGFFLWHVIKALWVKVDPPRGTELAPAQAPALFSMIDELRHRLGAPPFHHVLVTDDFNAGVVQSPRLGMFGWHRNYLLIGLPLVKSLSAEQFKAVLAHEFGHLAKGHGRLSNWIYRQRLRWSRLMEVLEASESKGGFLFKPFLNWFAPYFNAYSFPLARANEYEADATAARLTSPRAVAEALTSVNVVGSYLDERYWPQIHRLADDQPRPGFAPYSSMGERVAAEVDPDSAQGWLERAMARQAGLAETHPALSQRLQAIGEAAHLAPPAPGTAADQLLGDALAALTESFDRRWHEAILPAWEERYRKVQEDRRRLAELDAKHAQGTELSLQEAYDRATLTEEAADNADGALEQFRALHARVPDDAIVRLSLAARLLTRDDETGIALVEQAMEIDPDLILRGNELLRDYHWRHGRTEAANAHHELVMRQAQLEHAAQKERNNLNLKDKYEAHGQPEEAIATLRAALQAVPGLRKAYFLKKSVKIFPHRPCYVLAYSTTRWFQWHSKKRGAAALEYIQKEIAFPGETLIIGVDGDNYRFGRKFRRMRGARVI